MIAKGPIARPGTPPTFSGRLSKVTGEGEQVELAFIADTPEELTARLAAAGDAATARLTTNNDVIVKAGATFEERQQRVYDAAVSTLRQEMSMRREEHEPPADEPAEDEPGEPVGPPAPGDVPAEGDEKPDADASAGALHPPAYP
jgi:hypothetical protein